MNLLREIKGAHYNKDIYGPHEDIEFTIPAENDVASKVVKIGDGESEHGPTTRSFDASWKIDESPSSTKSYLSNLEFKEDLANQNGHRSHMNIRSKTAEEYSVTSTIDPIGDRASEHGPPTRLYDVSSTVNGYPFGNNFVLSSLEYKDDLANQNGHGSHKNIKSTTPEEYSDTSKIDQIGHRVYPSSNKIYLSSSEISGYIPNQNETGSHENLKLTTSEEYISTSKVDQNGDRPPGHGTTTRSHDTSSSNNDPTSSNNFCPCNVTIFIYCHLYA